MVSKRTRLFAAILGAGLPLATTVSCDPYAGALSVLRFDDYGHDHGFWDVFIDDHSFYYDDCYFAPCYDDYYYDDYYYDEYLILDY